MAVLLKRLKKCFSVDRIFSEKENTAQSGHVVYSSFLENRKSYTGFYIDICPHHPYPFSNTSNFSQKGWQKIIIEPTCESANLFDFFSNAAAIITTEQSPKYGPTLLYYLNNKNTSGTPAEIATKGTTAFNTVIKTINVRETPLAVVLDNNLPAKQTIDFLSLDVAGLDMRALKSIDWNRYIPLFIIVKINAGQQRSVAPICSFLMRRNYEQAVQTNHAFLFKYNGK
jgi:hypothetical protein